MKQSACRLVSSLASEVRCYLAACILWLWRTTFLIPTSLPFLSFCNSSGFSPMAVVESAADGLALTLPALSLSAPPLPRNFSLLPPPPPPPDDPDLDQQQQHLLLHHHHHQHPQQQQQQQQQQRIGSGQQPHQRPNVVAHRESGTDGSSASSLDEQTQFSRESMRELEDLLSKLNPLAKEFVPPSRTDAGSPSDVAAAVKGNNFKTKNGYNSGKRRVNSRTSRAQREDSIRRTVYVSDIDQQVTEEQLAALFITCGQVVDCRVCGDPNSVLRFAFVEFTDEEGAQAALSLAGTMLGYYPVRVLPSKTAIVPVNPTFLPRSEEERELCARTVYCTNIDKKVSQADVKLFFESLCGEVARLRLLGDYHHSTRIAFVEFVMAESAMAALNCSGAILGSLPIRVSPSKTPVRPRSPRPILR